jgi:hypothetical protein
MALALVPVFACGRETAPTPPPQSPPSPEVTARAAPTAAPAAPSASVTAPEGGAPATTAASQLGFTGVALPGVSPPAFLDYIAWEPAHSRVWVPVANTGSVDVFSPSAGTFTRVDGFKTAERENRGKKRTVGPNAVSIGDGFAYVGNRATGEVCPVDLSSLKAGRCIKLPSPSDGVAYVPTVKEVWVTTPADRSIAVLDASVGDTLRAKTTVRLDGAPEGYASDGSRNLFFTNLEDKNKTVVIDVKTHKTKVTWDVDCGGAGPRGIAAEVAHRLVFVACTDRVLVLDGARDGAKVASLDAGEGIDNIDWLEAKRLLYVAAARAAKLVIATVDDRGQPSVIASATTTDGARNAVAGGTGNVYATDSLGARLLVFSDLSPVIR